MTAALIADISAIKNLKIAKACRQQMAPTSRVPEMLSLMTNRLVSPEDENLFCFQGKNLFALLARRSPVLFLLIYPNLHDPEGHNEQ